MSETNHDDVLARYGNWYRGDDDLFAHCLIRRKGDCVRIFQGLQTVTTQIAPADARMHARLVDMLDDGIPAEFPSASYQGYNFVTDPEGPDASEIAVHGVQAGDNRPPGQYYAATTGSEIGRLVKEIAQLD